LAEGNGIAASLQAPFLVSRFFVVPGQRSLFFIGTSDRPKSDATPAASAYAINCRRGYGEPERRGNSVCAYVC
jgi:hypothetical protein